MPKTPKNEPATEDNPETAASTTAVGEARQRAAKKRKQAAKGTTAKKTSPKKKTSSARAKKAAPKQRNTPVEAAEPSDADIRLRAYFIAERRVQLALQGDPGRDWIEARQQLIEEARQPRP